MTGSYTLLVLYTIESLGLVKHINAIITTCGHKNNNKPVYQQLLFLMFTDTDSNSLQLSTGMSFTVKAVHSIKVLV